MPAETTVAVIENASRGDRRLLHGTLSDLPDLEHRDELNGPVMVIIGDAVAGANFEHSEPLVARRAGQSLPRLPCCAKHERRIEEQTWSTKC